MTQPRILVLEERPGQPLGTQIQAILRREGRYRVDLLEGPLPEGMEGVEPHPGLIIPVLSAPQERAEHFLAALRAKGGDTPLLPVLGANDLNGGPDGLLRWARDFLVAPLRETELLARVRRLLPGSREPGRDRVKENGSETAGLEQLIGEDPAFVLVKRKLPLMARCEAPVLITGETGTGKELCARALHYLSRRAAKPFLPVNCGAIPVELFESELFGHQKGAFTGAWAAQPGLVAEAEGGSLFLDEIEALSLGAQVKLLRFLEDRTYHALGSPRPRQADVRILAATNVELTQRVREGSFREDLFYRLAVLTLTLPPLRERPADIPLLAAHWWKRCAEQLEGERKRLSPRALEALCRYRWPGNIRELENVLQQALVLTDAPTIEPEDLPLHPEPAPETSISRVTRPQLSEKTHPPSLPSIIPGVSMKQARAQVIEQFEKAYIAELLRTHRGNVTQAARAARMERRALGRLIQKYQLAKG